MGAAAGFALQRDLAAVGEDDFFGGGQSQAGAAALGGIEGVENARPGVGVHAAAGVDQIQRHALWSAVGADYKLAAAGHGLFGIEDQIQKRAVECLGIQKHHGQIAG